MEDKTAEIFLRVREGFPEVKEKVSLVRPYVQMMAISKCWVLKSGEFERFLGFKPELLYKSSENVYAISMLFRINDDITAGIIAQEFAEITAAERGIRDQELIDAISVESGFGKEVLHLLQNELFTESDDICFVGGGDLEKRIGHIKELLGESAKN